MIWRMIADPVKKVLIFLTVGLFVVMSIYLWFETGRMKYEADYYKLKYENCIQEKGGN